MAGIQPLRQPISDLTASFSPHQERLLPFILVYGVLLLFFALFLFLRHQKVVSRLVYVGYLVFSLPRLYFFLHLFPEDLPEGTVARFSGILAGYLYTHRFHYFGLVQRYNIGVLSSPGGSAFASPFSEGGWKTRVGSVSQETDLSIGLW